MTQQGLSVKAMPLALGPSASTIGREVVRNTVGVSAYASNTAQVCSSGTRQAALQASLRL